MINDGFPLDLEMAEITKIGHTRHGIARAGQLRRLDGVIESYPTTPANGEALVFRIPGLPTPPAWPEPGRELRDYLLISGSRAMIYSLDNLASAAACWLYLDSAGRRWLATVTAPTPTTTITASVSTLSVSVHFELFGDNTLPAASVTRTHVITAATLLGDDLATLQGGHYGLTVIGFSDIPDYQMRLEDTTRTGGKALFSWTHARAVWQAQALPTWYRQRNAVAFAEMTITLAEDDMPDFDLANVKTRFNALPAATYSGPVDAGTGCPFGSGNRHWEVPGRIVGGVYDDADALQYVSVDLSWDYVETRHETVIYTAHVYPHPPAPPYTDSATASASSIYGLHIGAEGVEISVSETNTVTVDSEGGSYPVTISKTTIIGEDTITSASGGGGAGCTTVDTGDPENDPFNWHCAISAQAASTQPYIPVLCPASLTNPDNGEWPPGLTPSLSTVGLSTLAKAFIVRFSASLWGILHQRYTGDLWIDALVTPSGSVTSYTLVVACTVGTSDPDCLAGGYKYITGTLGNLGSVDIANLRGSHNRQTGEVVIATDGTPVCFV